MFSSYLEKLSHWLESQNLLLKAEAFSLKQVNLSELPPEPLTLWTNYLQTAFFDTFYQDFFSFETNRFWFSKQLLSFSSYGFQTKLNKMLESSCLPSSRALLENLSVFQQKMESWITGENHQLVLEDRLEAVRFFKEIYQFETEWNASNYLDSLGYHIPHSENSFKAWKRYSGQSKSSNDYFIWWKTLTDFCSDPQSAHKLDRLLDLIFNPQQQFVQTTLCLKRTSCNNCPLTGDCAHFKDEMITSDLSNDLNFIKTGDLKELQTDDLLKFLMQDEWEGSEKQKHLLAKFPDISFKEFAHQKSANDDKTVALLLVIKELCKRYQTETEIDLGMTINNAADIYQHLKYLFSETPQESFYELILDNKNRVLEHRLISLGTLNRSLVHPREVFAPAIQLRAAAVILVHNHPSGDPTPSQQDFSVTHRLKEVGEIVGITVLDHIIIGRNGFYSFMDHHQL